MQDLIATRKQNILQYADGRIDTCKSINAAKKKSREIQLANGGLGVGAVQKA